MYDDQRARTDPWQRSDIFYFALISSGDVQASFQHTHTHRWRDHQTILAIFKRKQDMRHTIYRSSWWLWPFSVTII